MPKSEANLATQMKNPESSRLGLPHHVPSESARDSREAGKRRLIRH